MEILMEDRGANFSFHSRWFSAADGKSEPQLSRAALTSFQSCERRRIAKLSDSHVFL